MKLVIKVLITHPFVTSRPFAVYTTLRYLSTQHIAIAGYVMQQYRWNKQLKLIRF
jgi:hypothetical protein